MENIIENNMENIIENNIQPKTIPFWLNCYTDEIENNIISILSKKYKFNFNSAMRHYRLTNYRVIFTEEYIQIYASKFIQHKWKLYKTNKETKAIENEIKKIDDNIKKLEEENKLLENQNSKKLIEKYKKIVLNSGYKIYSKCLNLFNYYIISFTVEIYKIL